MVSVNFAGTNTESFGLAIPLKLVLDVLAELRDSTDVFNQLNGRPLETSVEVEPDDGDVFEDGEVPASIWDFFAVVDADCTEIDAADLDLEGDDVFDVAECGWADRGGVFISWTDAELTDQWMDTIVSREPDGFEGEWTLGDERRGRTFAFVDEDDTAVFVRDHDRELFSAIVLQFDGDQDGLANWWANQGRTIR